MSLEFKPIDFSGQHDYRQLFSQSLQKASDYSFVNLWGWALEYGLEWAFGHGLAWIRQTRPQVRYWAPVGAWDRIDWNHCRFPGRGMLEFIRVPEQLALVWQAQLGDRVRSQATRAQWDYLYRRQDLIELKGNRLHKKKNLLNQFMKKYVHQYTPLGSATVRQAMAMQTDWCTWRDCDSSLSLSSENRAVARILTHWEALHGLAGGALTVDGRMAAYTVAEALDADTVVIHFEKGDPAFKGVYQAINQMFLAHGDRSGSIVNREQDLGDEGLRKAKLSYQPFDFVPKCTVRVEIS